MSSKILINAKHAEEVRVAIIDEQKNLQDFDHDRLDTISRKGDICLGIVSRIEPSLNAAFVDFGSVKHGFLPIAEVAQQLYPSDVKANDRPPITSLLKEGQRIIVQVDKDERGTKGAALTTNISLAGCYIVLMPHTQDAGGISRQIEGEDREKLRNLLAELNVAPKMSVIVRTASIGRTLDDLLWDYNVLKSQWEAISQVSKEYDKPVLLYKDGALLSRTIRDYLKPEVQEIIIDKKEVYQQVLELVQHIRPDFLNKVIYYGEKGETVPLFSFYGIEKEIESIFNPTVFLSNGSSLVIDHREALTSIDINSAKATSQNDIDKTAFETNMLAAKEIARQLRLRNIGGQVVVDFIDMGSNEDLRKVEQTFREAIVRDKARIQLGKISKFGLLELSRQRLKTSLDEAQLMPCQTCHGRGSHRRPRSIGLSIIRLLQQESINQKNCTYEVKVHPKVGEYLYNSYRRDLCDMEERAGVRITITCQQEKGLGDYELVMVPAASAGKTIRNFSHTENSVNDPLEYQNPVTPAVSAAPKIPAPNPAEKVWWRRLWRAFFGSSQSSDLDSAGKNERRYRRNNRNNNNSNKKPHPQKKRDSQNPIPSAHQGHEQRHEPRPQMREREPHQHQKRHQPSEGVQNEGNARHPQQQQQQRRKPVAKRNQSNPQ